MTTTPTEYGWVVLDGERPDGEPFTARTGSTVLRFRAAVGVPAGVLVGATGDWRAFLSYMVINQRELVAADFPWWKAEHLMDVYRRWSGLCVTPTDDLRLLRLIDKRNYRDAIEADLQEIYRLDLVVEFQARRWRRLLNMIERTRRNSHLAEVMAHDEELATLILDREGDEKRDLSERPMAEFSAEVELLSVVADRLGELLQVQVSKAGGKSRPVKPQPRPKTAVAKLRDKRAMKHVDFTFDRLFGRVDERGRPTGKT